MSVAEGEEMIIWEGLKCAREGNQISATKYQRADDLRWYHARSSLSMSELWEEEFSVSMTLSFSVAPSTL